MDTDKFQELVLQQLENLNLRIGSIEKGQQTLEKGQQTLEKGQQTLEKSQQSLQQDVEKIRQSQVRMEFEHGEKLSALFDGYKSLSETMTDHTERLQRIEEKITTHDVQIKILDKTKSNKRKVKS
jgi:exonuclease VII small subunit